MKVELDKGVFLTREEIAAKTTYTIYEFVEKRPGRFGNEYHIRVVRKDGGNDDESKILSLFASDFNAFIEIFGNETNDWVGKDVDIDIETYVNGRGEMKKRFVFFVDGKPIQRRHQK